jgi:hypothetical protein
MRDAGWVLQQLRQALAVLAAPAEEQAAHLHTLGDAPVDELGLEFDDIAPAAFGLSGPNELDADQRAAVAAVDSHLSGMSGAQHSNIWTIEALREAPEWANLRELSHQALQRLDDSACH